MNRVQLSVDSSHRNRLSFWCHFNTFLWISCTSSYFCVKFFLANGRHHSCQPIHQSFTLRVTIDPIGHFDWSRKQEFNTEVFFAILRRHNVCVQNSSSSSVSRSNTENPTDVPEIFKVLSLYTWLRFIVMDNTQSGRYTQ